MGTRASIARAPRVAEPSRRHEVLGIVALSLTLLSALALFSYTPESGSNWIGAAGHGLANLLTTAFGFAAWVVPFELASFTVGRGHWGAPTWPRPWCC